ncbi:hypothetical protein QR680_018040 [Steinernema hermaphroditum]|uniref:Uncharacterized protein n=1 Tax=Steinernema hermaphroditum TaxID=289476 RepID=A0AA39LQG8_9BILA|nr:hypothetical protein QR680_018040 [Steinernema hermaphroditum]
MFFSDVEDFRNVRQTEYFPENRCLCGFMHVRTGTLIIGIVSMLLTCGGFAFYVVTKPSTTAWVSLGYDIYLAISCLCLFWGVYKECAELLLPYIIAQCLLMLHLAVVVVALIIGEIGTELIYDQFQRKSHKDKSAEREKEIETLRCIFAILIVILACVFVAVYYLYTVVRNCYLYLKTKTSERIRLYSYGPTC